MTIPAPPSKPPAKPKPPPTRRQLFRQRSQKVQRAGQRAYSVPAFIAGGRGRYTAKGILTAELIIGAGIVAIRAIGDYEPQADGTLKGKVGHPQGQYGPLPVLAGLIVTFFLLSFLAARGGTKGKVAVIAGGLIVLVLGMKSLDEFAAVSETFGTFGKAPPGDWETSGAQAGSPITGGSSGTGGGSSGGSGNGRPVKPGKHHKCPAGYRYDAQLNLCMPLIEPGPPAAG